MASNRPIPPREPNGGDRNPSRLLGTSYRSQTAIERYQSSVAEESIARDLDDPRALEGDLDMTVPAHDHLPTTQHSLTSSYRRPSHYASGPRPIFGILPAEAGLPAEQDWQAAIGEERSLLRDNKILPPKHPRKQASQRSLRSLRSVQGGAGGVLNKVLESVGLATEAKKPKSYGTLQEDGSTNAENGPALEEVEAHQDDSSFEAPDETTALIGRDPTAPYGGEGSPENVSRKWEEAVLAGQIQTTWQREVKVLARYSAPLMLTFILQNSLTLTSVFTVGHIGKVELGAVSLGSMTATITGYAVYQGLATSLDTLCAQAYGSGRRKLVGLQLQRMVYFLCVITIPIAIVWASATSILELVVPEREIADLAGQYLRVLIIGAPAYACFESGKRYVQAQGRFEATLYVLLITAPLNAFLHWLFVWRFEWGFIGCPIAVVITECLMPILLLLYVRFIAPNGMECWPGFTSQALRNWGPMIRLALPGLVMVVAEFLAFEILTLASARISATHLAANTVLQSLSILTYQLPFPLSIATSTRVANLIGAGLPDAAKITTRVAFIIGTVIGVVNQVLLSSLRFQIPWLFTSEEDVVALAAATLPVNAAFQLFDALATVCNGTLRGLGRQEVGGYVNLFAYYVIALPVSFTLAFGFHWDLSGLWTGPVFGLAIVAIFEGVFLYRTSYAKASEDAALRNSAA